MSRDAQTIDIPLEAVGLDVNRKVEPIERLSYARNPRPGYEGRGWHDGPFNNWMHVPVEGERDGRKTAPRELASQTVFKWYRIPDTVQTESLGRLTREEILGRIDVDVDSLEIFGTFNATDVPAENTAEGTPCEVPREFEHGIVKFKDHVFSIDKTAAYPSNKRPADLTLRAVLKPVAADGQLASGGAVDSEQWSNWETLDYWANVFGKHGNTISNWIERGQLRAERKNRQNIRIALFELPETERQKYV